MPTFVASPFLMDPSLQPVTAAQRRRGRRLRAAWRHEQQWIAAALATFTHHSALRGQTTATRTGEEGHEDKHDAPQRQKPSPPSRCSSQPVRRRARREAACQPGGAARATGTGPCMVQILDIPVPQMVDQPVAVLKHLDTPIPEQVIAMPKISSSSRCSRTVLREPQTAEQLVEGPPDVIAKIRLFEPIADIPALRGPIGTGGLLWFPPSTEFFPSVEQIVDIPVPLRRFPEISKVFTLDRVQQRVPSRTLTFQFLAVVFKIFAQARFQQLHPHFLALRMKKVRGLPGAGQCGAGCAPQLIHAEFSSNACRGSG